MQTNGNRTPRFEMGQLLMTPGVIEAVTRDVLAPVIPVQFVASVRVQKLLARHVRGDWGDVCADDAQANEDALKHGARLLSAYHYGEGRDRVKLWVITEADRSATTVLLPEEY